MTIAFRRFCRGFVAMLLLAAGTVASGASPYYITVQGAPASITCTNTATTSTFSFDFGATLVWNFVSAPTNVAVTFLANGNPVSSSNNVISTTNGSQILAGNGFPTFPLQTFPYPVVFRAIPATPGTDGMQLSFTCGTNGVGTGYAVVNVPAPAPVLQATPSPVTLPPTDYGFTSAPTLVTISNTGADAGGVAFANSNPAEFIVSGNTCAATIPQSSSCTFNVAFKPANTGARSGNLVVSRTGGPGITIPFNGTGTGTAPGALTFPATSNFADLAVGSTSAPTNITVTNTGGALVTVASVVSSNPAEFPVSTNCAAVPASASCTVGITFKPTAAGARSGTITVTSDGTGSPQTIAVSGNGTAVATPGQLSFATAVTFATQTLGTTSAPTNVTVTNTGGTAVNVSSITSNAPAEFGVSASGCTTVNAGATCALSLTFTPAAAGARNASITLVSNGTGSPQAIAVSGTGTAVATPGQLSLPGSISFGAQQVGTTSGASNISVTNVGGSTVNVGSVTSSNVGEFPVTSTCVTVAAGAGCTISVSFAPSAAGTRTASITVNSDGVGNPQLLSASGTGSTAPPPPPPATVTLIEYHHAEWDHYFMTGIPDEITKLDNGTFVGWARTGLSFKSYPLPTADSNTVCRFFSTSFAPRSSHFYTPFANECTIVKASPDWTFEGDVFYIPIPAIDGACAAGTVPVYRLYNNGQGAAPNHRYTIDFAVRAQMIARGWIPEGYGDIGVLMCAPL